MSEFKSILKDEIGSYIRLCQSEGKSIMSIQSGILNLDTYLESVGHTSKNLSADLMSSWISQLHPPKKMTIKWNVIVVRQFMLYLRTLGFDAFMPEVPAYHSDYIPYSLNDNEIARLFEAADALTSRRKDAKKSITQFSAYLRILYGCGLRSGEVLKLRKNNIDFSINALIIKCAKGKKDRIVPMSSSLALILDAYTQMQTGGADRYLFTCKNGRPRSVKWAYEWFQRVLKQSGIVYAKDKNERAGPSPYSMRHAFIHRSYMKYAGITGHSFDDIIPFLSAYVGHVDATGTDRYFRYDSGLFADENERMDSFIDELLPE